MRSHSLSAIVPVISVSCCLHSDDINSVSSVSCCLHIDDISSVSSVNCCFHSDDISSVSSVSCCLHSDDISSLSSVSCDLRRRRRPSSTVPAFAITWRSTYDRHRATITIASILVLQSVVKKYTHLLPSIRLCLSLCFPYRLTVPIIVYYLLFK